MPCPPAVGFPNHPRKFLRGQKRITSCALNYRDREIERPAKSPLPVSLIPIQYILVRGSLVYSHRATKLPVLVKPPVYVMINLLILFRSKECADAYPFDRCAFIWIITKSRNYGRSNKLRCHRIGKPKKMLFELCRLVLIEPFIDVFLNYSIHGHDEKLCACSFCH